MTTASSGQPCAGEPGRLHAVVVGRVQGVGYREFASSTARRLGCFGFVRNLADRRSVEVVAEGACARLEELLVALGHGPPGARVERVTVAWEHAVGEFDQFTVRV